MAEWHAVWPYRTVAAVSSNRENSAKLEVSVHEHQVDATNRLRTRSMIQNIAKTPAKLSRSLVFAGLIFALLIMVMACDTATESLEKVKDTDAFEKATGEPTRNGETSASQSTGKVQQTNAPLPTTTPTAASLPLPTATPKSTATPVPTATSSPPTPTPTITPGVPESSASAITSPPSDMEGINTHSEMYGTDADPNIITLGPKVGSHPDWEPYSNKTSMEFELKHGEPVLAPIDMVFIGFKNRNAKYKTYQDGQQDAPFNDLELCFKSLSPDWPGMIICTYHLSTSPLLLGHNQNPDCGEVEEWGSTQQVQGHIFYAVDDYSQENGNARSCEALIGHSIKRGEVIGFAGSVGHPRSLKEKNEGEYITVGTNPQAPFRFKVSHTSENPTVQKGNRYLHWVQPGSFFYWKCYSPGADFPSGVLAYPFECGEYQLPAEQHDVNFKYSSKK